MLGSIDGDGGQARIGGSEDGCRSVERVWIGEGGVKITLEMVFHLQIQQRRSKKPSRFCLEFLSGEEKNDIEKEEETLHGYAFTRVSGVSCVPRQQRDNILSQCQPDIFRLLGNGECLQWVGIFDKRESVTSCAVCGACRGYQDICQTN